MNTQQIKQAYQAIATNYDWMAPLNTEALSVNSQTLPQDEIFAKLHAFNPVQGWLQTLDKVMLIDVTIPEIEPDNWIESGELINAEGDTVHIRPANQNKLHFVSMSSQGNTEYFVTEMTHQIKYGSQKGEATYKLYWESDNCERTQAKFSRLVNIAFLEKK